MGVGSTHFIPFSGHGITGAGRSLATGLIKLVPWAGTVVGGMIGAGVASSVTAAMGAAWITVCKRYGSDSLVGSVAFDPTVLQKAFTEEMGRRLRGIGGRKG